MKKRLYLHGFMPEINKIHFLIERLFLAVQQQKKLH